MNIFWHTNLQQQLLDSGGFKDGLCISKLRDHLHCSQHKFGVVHGFGLTGVIIAGQVNWLCETTAQVGTET